MFFKMGEGFLQKSSKIGITITPQSLVRSRDQVRNSSHHGFRAPASFKRDVLFQEFEIQTIPVCAQATRIEDCSILSPLEKSLGYFTLNPIFVDKTAKRRTHNF